MVYVPSPAVRITGSPFIVATRLVSLASDTLKMISPPDALILELLTRDPDSRVIVGGFWSIAKVIGPIIVSL